MEQRAKLIKGGSGAAGGGVDDGWWGLAAAAGGEVEVGGVAGLRVRRTSLGG